ncbi:MAG: ATP-binding protein [Flavobacteriaceae bacterium]|nr:ATP-binding protein [Flavobacteriaceae bacterium]
MSSEKRIMVSDRGRAHYFHGREQEIDAFEDVLELSKENKKGHSMLIQGAPGVGKTALLRELEKRGSKLGWTIAKMEFEALSNVNELHHVLIGEKEYEKRSQEVSANIKVAEGSMRYDRTERTVSKIIRSISKPLILVLDEAQMICVGRAIESPEIKKIAELFDQLHNIELKHGLVFLIAGLSDTRSIFKEFKISRFSDDCVINLSTLDREAENKILKDYLVQGANVDANDSSLKDWMDQMSRETHQWAHHVSCYGQVASKKVNLNGGRLSSSLLFEVLRESRRKKNNYYNGRFEELEALERASIFNALFENEEKENVIVGFKVKSDFKTNPMIEHPEKMFQEVVSRGIIQIRRDGFYQIPIPSLRTWMLQEYENYLKTMNENPSQKVQQLIASIQSPEAMKSNHQKTTESWSCL